MCEVTEGGVKNL